MILIPAIDLKGGKCVRLRQGREDTTTVYSDDPVAVARHLVEEGAERLHVVNLDGAFGRTSVNLEVFGRIAAEANVVLEFGGGLRTLDDMRMAFDAGADKLVLGTAAIEQPALLALALVTFGPVRLIVALDAHNGLVATRGWTHVTGLRVLDATLMMKEQGVAELLYTDIGRDGMFSGTDNTTLRDLASVGVNIIASGGVGHLEDIRALRDMQLDRIIGVIVGKALYEEKFSLRDALRLLQPGHPDPGEGGGTNRGRRM
jgi:phosphoribosylformimino-5-aminoimidazole carboxamide ribotide isomerase